jgi:hypothetical protein
MMLFKSFHVETEAVNLFLFYFGGKEIFSWADLYQRCQMVCFQTQNPNLGKLWSLVIEDVEIIYGQFGIPSLRSFGIFYCHLVMLW